MAPGPIQYRNPRYVACFKRFVVGVVAVRVDNDARIIAEYLSRDRYALTIALRAGADLNLRSFNSADTQTFQLFGEVFLRLFGEIAAGGIDRKAVPCGTPN